MQEQRQLEHREFADDSEHRFSQAELSVKKLTQETERLQGDLRKSQETMSSLKSELKENQQQRRGLSVELNEISDK